MRAARQRVAVDEIQLIRLAAHHNELQRYNFLRTSRLLEGVVNYIEYFLRYNEVCTDSRNLFSV